MRLRVGTFEVNIHRLPWIAAYSENHHFASYPFREATAGVAAGGLLEADQGQRRPQPAQMILRWCRMLAEASDGADRVEKGAQKP